MKTYGLRALLNNFYRIGFVCLLLACKMKKEACEYDRLNAFLASEIQCAEIIQDSVKQSREGLETIFALNELIDTLYNYSLKENSLNEVEYTNLIMIVSRGEEMDSFNDHLKANGELLKENFFINKYKFSSEGINRKIFLNLGLFNTLMLLLDIKHELILYYSIEPE
jgi:hypothetical protein